MLRVVNLATPRLVGRRWTAEDAALARELWGDAEVTRFITRAPLDEAGVEAWLRREIDADAADGVSYWPWFTRDAPTALVGCGGLRPRAPDVFEVGAHLRPAFWRRGLGEEIGRGVCAIAFDVLGARALFAGHHPSNVASRRLLERLGFRRTHDELYPPTGLAHPSYELTRDAWFGSR